VGHSDPCLAKRRKLHEKRKVPRITLRADGTLAQYFIREITQSTLILSAFFIKIANSPSKFLPPPDGTFNQIFQHWAAFAHRWSKQNLLSLPKILNIRAIKYITKSHFYPHLYQKRSARFVLCTLASRLCHETGRSVAARSRILSGRFEIPLSLPN